RHRRAPWCASLLTASARCTAVMSRPASTRRCSVRRVVIVSSSRECSTSRCWTRSPRLVIAYRPRWPAAPCTNPSVARVLGGAPQRAHAVAPADLLALGVGAAVVGDTDFEHAPAPAGALGGDLRF